MFQPNYPKAALGLEKNSITVLALQKEGRQTFGIRQAATVELPDGSLCPGFTEKNIVDPDALLFFLDKACVKAGLNKQKRWSVSLPANTARTVILTLETVPTSKRELEEILDWKAENVFGVPAAEMRLSFARISPDASGKERYLTTAVKLHVIDEYETLFESLGWHAGLILPRALSEANWLMEKNSRTDSLLISSHDDGFTALLLRGSEPLVIRRISCAESEIDDEIYRLLMFYNDRFATTAGEALEKVLVVGQNLNPHRIREISGEALGRELSILRPEEVGLIIPPGRLSFNDLAAPAGIAALGF